MIIYKDIVSGDEMFSDCFKIKEVGNGLLYEVEGKTVVREEGFDESCISANPSAEECTESNDVACARGVDIILNHKLQQITYSSKKVYLNYLKEYMKNLKTVLEENKSERFQAFSSGIEREVKTIMGNYKDYEFFSGESMHPEGMVGLLNYREDGITPYMLFFKDGLVVEKF